MIRGVQIPARRVRRVQSTRELPRGGQSLLSLRPRLPTGATRHACPQSRTFVEMPTILLPPVVFGGLVIALWSWKCLMMVVFQNRIIYMPGLPPNARRERIEDYKNRCSGIQWREERIRSLDGTRISLCVASVKNGAETIQSGKGVYILYFQGNASSLPPRLPLLSPILRMLRDQPPSWELPIRYTMVCCSYRGFWTSRGRPSEKGIAMDAAAALHWIKTDHSSRLSTDEKKSEAKVPVVIWGQSIGAGIAANLASRQYLFFPPLFLHTLILETPFLSVRAMLEALYPQKWLPYRHLWPFLRNHLDSWGALGTMARACRTNGISLPRILILEAGKDELVPKEHGDALEARCLELELNVRKETISGALHTEVLVRPAGRLAVVQAVKEARTASN